MGSIFYPTQSEHVGHRAINQSGQIRNFSPLTWTNILCFGMGSTGGSWKMWPTIDYLWLISEESNQWSLTIAGCSVYYTYCTVLPPIAGWISWFLLQNPQPGNRSKHCGSVNFSDFGWDLHPYQASRAAGAMASGFPRKMLLWELRISGISLALPEIKST